MSSNDIYFSIDVETDGPIPGKNSMLSLGCGAFQPTPEEPERMVDEFEINFLPYPGAVQDENTMTEFWAKHPEAWDYTQQNQIPAEYAMRVFLSWVASVTTMHGGKPVCVAYPAGFDFMFVYWYIVATGQQSPFSFSCVDMKTYAMAVLGKRYRQSTKRGWPKAWFSDRPHTHKAVDDAIEQGISFCRMLQHRSGGDQKGS